MFTVAYKPHLGFCTEFYTVSAKTYHQALRLGLLLNFYQTFLSENNHSQPPKARIELWDASGKRHARESSFIHDLNHHAYYDLESLDDFSHCKDANDWGLKLNWLPQVPCKAFSFPVMNLDEAEIFYDALAFYDNYLLTSCDNMRVDYANQGFLMMIDPDWVEGQANNEIWVDWYYECGDTYYEDFNDYLNQKVA